MRELQRQGGETEATLRMAQVRVRAFLRNRVRDVRIDGLVAAADCIDGPDRAVSELGRGRVPASVVDAPNRVQPQGGPRNVLHADETML